MQNLLYYLAAVNLIAFVVYGADKRRAKLSLRRVPERTLLLLAALGGALGALLAMELFRHKTRHLLFRLGVPTLLLLQAALVFFLLRRFG